MLDISSSPSSISFSSSLQLPSVFPPQTVAYTTMPVGASISGPGSHLPYIVTGPAVQVPGQKPTSGPTSGRSCSPRKQLVFEIAYNAGKFTRHDTAVY